MTKVEKAFDLVLDYFQNSRQLYNLENESEEIKKRR